MTMYKTSQFSTLVLSRFSCSDSGLKVLDMNIIILVTHPSVSPPVSPDAAVIPEVKTDLRSEGEYLDDTGRARGEERELCVGIP